MRILAPLALAAAALASPAIARERVSPDEAVAKALASRIPGKDQSCINLWRDVHAHIVGNAVIYQDGRTWYVSRPSGGHCDDLRPDRIIVNETILNRLCSGDIIRIAIPPLGPVGTCVMDKFTPYTLPKK